ncbi:cAMP-independent regulatory protein pac2 [Astathelohania contejeani]|uniref:cAMP-independent regulatory protein pac2 n=1 Tax=Astathelohania contejeani TaxID=164912 RepID=A0ABQ7I0L8_9MICR|nr:cAMP-independent regulatory protein pac2 [Thelohania contejeani]
MEIISGYIHDFEEAILIMHCIRLRIFKPNIRRLKDDEKECIKSGSIFCFIESENGIRRWTDGKIWSPSKILGKFLLYKEVPPHLSKTGLKLTQKGLYKRGRGSINYGSFENGGNSIFNLFKKTISIRHENKTYHIISYFQPVFSRISLKNIPFYQELRSILIKYPDLLKDSIIDDLFEKGEDVYTMFNISLPTFDTMKPDIDRRDSELQAAEILHHKMNLNFIK